MPGHIQITFAEIQPEQQDWVIAHLAEAGFEGFEQQDRELKAFISEAEFDNELLKELAFKYQLEYKQETIKAQNWNEVWESAFEPVWVDDFVAIRADFHAPIKNVEHEIIITPKMSFGTGHHATTHLMIDAMRKLELENKSVLDFGTGTGVLAILASKLGASSVVAIDIDEWSILNAKENILRNNCPNIQLVRSGQLPASGKFSIILANINKNVIVDNASAIGDQLESPGKLLLSGLLEEDEEDIRSAFRKYNLEPVGRSTRNGWLSIRLERY